MKRIILLSLLIGVLTFPCMVYADSILVTGSDLIGSRSTPELSGIVATDGWDAENGGFTISWNINYDSGVWNYSYTFNNVSGGVPNPDMSHLILEVSPIITEANLSSYLWDFKVNEEITGFDVLGPKEWESGNENPYIPGVIYGIKFDDLEDGSYLFTFKSTQAPIWGDFYTKDGQQSGTWATAWNTGFGTDPTLGTTDFTKWIPTPDTLQVPEPGILILLGIAMSAIGVASWKIRKL